MKNQIKIKKLNFSKETMSILSHQQKAKILGGDITTNLCPTTKPKPTSAC
jgi:hypothetical protein